MRLHEKGPKDRRIQKTQKLLHDALYSLIHEKDYDAIVVKEILDRANVGRSTFYMHFRDKDELLVCGMHDMLRSVQSMERPSSAKPYERIIWFSLPIFEHINHHQLEGKANLGARGRAIIHGHLQSVVAELIAEDVKKCFQGGRKAAARILPDIIVQYVASTFILVLNWWVESRNPLPPDGINSVFRALVVPTLMANFGSEA